MRMSEEELLKLVTLHKSIKNSRDADKIIDNNKEKAKITLILDNARMNHCKRLLEYIEKQEIKIELWYLPPYSAHLNLIERLLFSIYQEKALGEKNYSSIIRFEHVLDEFFRSKVHKKKRFQF